MKLIQIVLLTGALFSLSNCGESDDEQETQQTASYNFLNANELEPFNQKQIATAVDFCRAIEKKSESLQIGSNNVFVASSQNRLCESRSFSSTQEFKLKIVSENNGQAPQYQH